MFKKISRFDLLVFIISLLLAFTPFYGLSYLLLILTGTRKIHFQKAFPTAFGRGILCFLMATSVIMITGLVAWVLRLPAYPILGIGSLILILSALPTSPRNTNKLADKGDLVSLAISLIAPFLVLFSFYLPNASSASVYQFISTGWDNGSHINMLQDSTRANGYFYGSGDGGKFYDSAERFRAYPQGWHLANATLVNGFGVQPLNPSHPITTLHFYFFLYLGWFTIAAFCFTRLAWTFTLPLLKKEDLSPLELLTFTAPVILIHAIIFYGSLIHGFANYLGCLAYLVVIFAMAFEKDKKAYLMALLMSIAATLSWILPLPAVALILLLGFFDTRRLSLQSLLPHRGNLTTFITTCSAMAIVILQILIFAHFTQSKSGQIGEGSLNGTFPVSQLLTAIIAIASGVFWIKQKEKGNKVILTIGSFSLLAFAIYVYQILTLGEVSYYYGKTLAFVLLAGGLFFVPAFVVTIMGVKNKYQLTSFSVALLSMVTIGLLIMGSSQTTSSFNFLFQRNSKVQYNTAQAIVNYLAKEDPNRTKLVVMRHQKRTEDNNGYLYSLLPNLPYTCANYVTGTGDLAVQLKNLDRCASSLDKNIVVITSDKTKSKVEDLRRDNIRIVNVP